MSILSAIEQVIPMLRARTWHAGATLRLDDAVSAELTEALERARVVGVLDAWAESEDSLNWSTWDCGPNWACGLTRAKDGVTQDFYGSSADAARAAAAKAIEEGSV